MFSYTTENVSLTGSPYGLQHSDSPVDLVRCKKQITCQTLNSLLQLIRYCPPVKLELIFEDEKKEPVEINYTVDGYIGTNVKYFN